MRKIIKTSWFWAFSLCLLVNVCSQGQSEKMAIESKALKIKGNLVFFYYPDLEVAENFYTGILGMEKVLDYGFAKICRLSPTSFIGLVDETKGMHDPSEPKTVTLSFLTEEIDQWYQYFAGQGVEMIAPLKDAERHPTRGFVAFDPAGYYLEFEKFLDHPQNALLLEKLAGTEALYPDQNQQTSRPAHLGIQANIVWLYYQEIPEAQAFYEQNFGFGLIVDQGFAKVYSSSPTGFIGLVDESKGLHRFTALKAVNVAFLTDQIKEWFAHLKKRGINIKDPLKEMESIPVRAFVGYDPAGYFIEFDQFLPDSRNLRMLDLLH
jgi:catechol 2,3-dioxygenase-like lactoylglutathione lyase family enzyme